MYKGFWAWGYEDQSDLWSVCFKYTFFLTTNWSMSLYAITFHPFSTMSYSTESSTLSGMGPGVAEGETSESLSANVMCCLKRLFEHWPDYTLYSAILASLFWIKGSFVRDVGLDPSIIISGAGLTSIRVLYCLLNTTRLYQLNHPGPSDSHITAHVSKLCAWIIVPIRRRRPWRPPHGKTCSTTILREILYWRGFSALILILKHRSPALPYIQSLHWSIKGLTKRYVLTYRRRST